MSTSTDEAWAALMLAMGADGCHKLRDAMEGTARDVAREVAREEVEKTIATLKADRASIIVRLDTLRSRVEHLYDMRDEDLQAEQERSPVAPTDMHIRFEGDPGKLVEKLAERELTKDSTSEVGEQDAPALSGVVTIRDLREAHRSGWIRGYNTNCSAERQEYWERRDWESWGGRRTPPAPIEGSEGEVDLPPVVKEAAALLTHPIYRDGLSDEVEAAVQCLQREVRELTGSRQEARNEHQAALRERDSAREERDGHFEAFQKKREEVERLRHEIAGLKGSVQVAANTIESLREENARLRDPANWGVRYEPVEGDLPHMKVRAEYVGPPESEGESDG